MEDNNKAELETELRNLVANADGEFTPDEATKAVELRDAITASNEATTMTEDVENAAGDSEVESTEEVRAAQPVQNTFNMNTTSNRFSLGKAVKEAANGNITGFEAEVIKESRNAAASNGISPEGSIVLDPTVMAEMRAAGDFQADSAVSGEAGGPFVGVDVATPMYTLRPKSIFDRLGATRLTGLKGDLNLPVGAAAIATTVGEVGDANQNASSITSNTLTPQRIGAMLTTSKQLLAQSEANVESFLMGDLMRAMGQAQDTYFMAQLMAGLTEVDGTGLDVAAVIAAMEGNLDTAGANRDAAEFLIHPDAFQAARTAAMVAGVNAVADAKSIIGYNTVISSQASDVTNGGVAVLGDFADFVIGEWNGLDLTVDPYSAAHKSQVRIIANSHVDATIRQAGNFSAYYNFGA